MGKLKSSRLSYNLVESFPDLSVSSRQSRYESKDYTYGLII